jgi:Transglycosylase SLT domain
MFIETFLNAIGSGVTGIGSSVTGAIQKAASATGTGFSYLLATAQIESGLNPEIKAKTSSATGLFQFIEQTWLQTMKQSGAELGYGRYAAAIERASSGRYVVSDPALRAEILNLRKDPTANASMAGALTRHNADRLRARIGRDPTEGELYIAHFLGAGGAGKLITAAAKNPHVKAADLFPRAAAANRSIFYDKQGGARSVTGVYGVLVTKLARAMPKAAPSQIAQAAPSAPPAPARMANAAPGMFSPTRVSSVSPAIQMPPLAPAIAPLMAQPAPAVSPIAVAAATPAAVSARSPVAPAAPVVPTGPVASAAPVAPAASDLPVAPLAYAQEARHPVFHDLFRTDGRSGVSSTVSELWGARTASAPPPPAVVTPGGAISRSNGTERRLDVSPRTGRSPT